MTKAKSAAPKPKKKSELILEEAEKIRAHGAVTSHEEKTYQLITFSLADGWYGLDITYVRHTYWAGEITPIPGLPDYILGVTNFMGEIVSVVDLCPLLGLKRASKASKPSLIIVDCGGITTSLFVDSLGSVIEIPERSIDSTLPALSKSGAEFILGSAKVENLIVNVIDLNKLMQSEKMKFE